MLKARRISATHRDAFLERYKGLHAWAVQMTANDEALAEDLLHDLFILFTLNQPDLQRIENLDNYLYACLRNLHISQLRRATRGRFEQLSLIEYDSARLGLGSVAHGRDWIQVQDELRRICHYANARKVTANAASVLILRFFHGYYPSEIAKILGVNCAAVNKRLMAARLEAKAYLENSKSLSFINSDTPEVFPAKFARTPGDFLIELQETIFQSRPGECQGHEELKRLYKSDRESPVARKHIAHLVSCPACLDTVNNLLGLPLLAERYPTDTMDKDNKKGGGPPDAPDKNEPGRKLKDWEREARDAYEHRPQELCVSVNGYLLGSQLIGSELSELTLNVAADERINFCEVFSEQGVRLMMMNVDELPPNGPGELRQRLSLSESRTLESALLFSNPFPTLQVTYHDPALAVDALPDTSETSVDDIADAPHSVRTYWERRRPRLLGFLRGSKFEAADEDTCAPRTEAADKSPAKLFDDRHPWASVGRLVNSLRAKLFNADFWFRPATATALIAIALISVIIFVQLRQPIAVLTAADLLQRSSLADDAIASSPNQVVHRTINLEARSVGQTVSPSTPGQLISRQRVEIWQSADRGITARRLYDDRNQLVAGNWRRSDGVETLYHHGSKPQLQLSPDRRAKAPINKDRIWQLSPSAKDFSLLVGGKGAAQVETSDSSYIISAQSVESADVLRATLTLNKSDLHPRELVVVLRDPEPTEYRFTELSFERRSPSAVAPVVFEPEPELLSEGASRRVGETAISPSPILPLAPSPVVATSGLEIEVLRLLSQVGADFGEQVNVKRTPEGQLSVEGVVDTAKRKSEILQALASVVKNSALRVDIVTPEEAARRLARATQGSVILQDVSPTSNRIPVDDDLRRYFSVRGLTSEQMDQEVQRFSDRTLAHSRQTMVHAQAIRNLVQRFSAENLRTLEPEARVKWLSLIHGHAQSLLREVRLQRQELSPVFNVGSLTDEGDGLQVTDDASLLVAVERLFDLCAARDEKLRAAFSISADASSVSALRAQPFWLSLKSSESLAEKIIRAQ